MAASHCDPSIAIKFRAICGDSFYFEEAETDAHLQEDAFIRFRREGETFSIQSKENKFLILTTDGNLRAQDLDLAARKQPECKFTVQFYCDSQQEAKLGKPVMLYSNNDGQKMVVCCRNDKEVYPRPMEIPRNITGIDHEAMFYRKLISTDRYMFESTKYKNMYLAFEPDQGNPGCLKLLLHHKEEDEVDESCHISCQKLKT